MKRLLGRLGAAGALALVGALGTAAQAEPKFKADVPDKITTPDSVETSIGTLKFHYGVPDAATAALVYDNLDRMRGVQAFLTGISATSVRAMCNGLDTAGVKANGALGITEEMMDARTLFLTPNTTTPYAMTCLDLRAGAVVMTVPAGVLGPVDDGNFAWVTDIGLTGPDKGKGGTYVFLPPGTKDKPEVPDGAFVFTADTNTLLVFFRVFVEKGDVAGSVKAVKDGTKIHLLDDKAPPATTFVNLSGNHFNTISANDINFFDELNQVVQTEPEGFVDPATTGLFASIGIVKGKDFAPDERMKKLLTDAVAIGNATARSLVFAPRDKAVYFYPDRKWFTTFIGGSYEFLNGASLLMDARTMFFYYATGITPAMAAAKPGTGSAYAIATHDGKGETLDGAKTYKVTLPGPVPAKQFWSFVVYDNITRSLLETDQKSAGVDSTAKGLKLASDGSATVYFGPKVPEGEEANWVQTMPGKGYNVILRLYGPLEPWFDKSWKPGDFELAE